MALRMLHLDALREQHSRTANRQTDLEMQTPVQGSSSDRTTAAEASISGQGISAVSPPNGMANSSSANGQPTPLTTTAVEGGEAGVSTTNPRQNRWTRSAIIARISAARERERQDNLNNAFDRFQLAQQLRGFEVAMGAAGATDGNAAGDATRGAGGTAMSTSALIAGRKDAKSRREREEASSLLGPSLAHYFGSGSSSSGTVGGVPNTASAAANSSDAVEGHFPAETPGVCARGAARLGSRGRARGASLSGLSALGQYGEASESQASFEPQHTQRSSLADPLAKGSHTEGPLDAMTEAVAMAEGIDIEILKQWIKSSLENEGAVQIDGTGEEAVEKALRTPSHCTALQSFVNLKRNTLRLIVSSNEEGGVATTALFTNTPLSVAVEDSSFSQFAHPLRESSTEGDEAFHSVRSLPVIQESDLRPARSLSMMPQFGTAAVGSSSTLGPATHQLHFEYDCSSPQASIQIFLRASRKHGSWQNWAQKRDNEEAADGLVGKSMYEQRGPAPHVLGWPVHSSLVKCGFAQPVRASLSLKLSLYAPPSTSTGGEGVTAVQSSTFSPVEGPAPASSFSPGIVSNSKIPPAIPAEETKEQRAAREKAERETLKLSIVIEALNESGRPFAEPNLQTTYMRLTSLPIRSPSPSGLGGREESKRIWTAHVEGQEAEIGPHRFQLQELYGLSSRPPPVIPVSQTAEGAEGGNDGAGANGATTEDTFALDMSAFEGGASTGSECLICLSAPTNTLLLPCTHGLCLDCSVQLKDSVKAQRDAERKRGKVPKKKYNCPMCRRGFTSMLHLQVATDQEEEVDGAGAGGVKTRGTIEEMS